MLIEHFTEIEPEFSARVRAMVWCSAATVDARGRPRSRILHPIWEGATGWVGTHRSSHKAKHLARSPYLSLAYISQPAQPVYVDCTAQWIDDLAEKQRIWDLFKSTPEPVGYDPASTFISPDHPDFGLLKLTPWRIALTHIPSASFDEYPVWRSDR